MRKSARSATSNVHEMKAAAAEEHVTIIYISTSPTSMQIVAMHDGLLKLPHHEQALLTPAVHWETSPLHAAPQPNN